MGPGAAGHDLQARAPVAGLHAGRPGRQRGRRRGAPRLRAALEDAPTAEARPSPKQLRRQLEAAVAQEDYAGAARLRDALRALEAEDPGTLLRAQLREAVGREDYTEAARLRDALQALPPEQGPVISLPCTSDTVTEGVRVRVSSSYAKARSNSTRHFFLFVYQVRILNQSDRTVQLRNRHWHFTDAEGNVNEVRGPGVVGKEPILAPGKAFEYSSYSPLATTSGAMEGTFDMAELDPQGREVRRFDAVVGKTGLSVDCPICL